MSRTVCIQQIQPLSEHQVFMAVDIWAKGQGRDREGQTEEIAVSFQLRFVNTLII